MNYLVYKDSPNYTKMYQIFLNGKESAYPFILILTRHSTLNITDNELNMQNRKKF